MATNEDATPSKLLEYELTVFTDLQAEDGLVITAKYAKNKMLLSGFGFIYYYQPNTFYFTIP